MTYTHVSELDWADLDPVSDLEPLKHFDRLTFDDIFSLPLPFKKSIFARKKAGSLHNIPA